MFGGKGTAGRAPDPDARISVPDLPGVHLADGMPLGGDASWPG